MFTSVQWQIDLDTNAIFARDREKKNAKIKPRKYVMAHAISLSHGNSNKAGKSINSVTPTYFLASDDGGLLGTSGLSRTNSNVINVRDSRYCCV